MRARMRRFGDLFHAWWEGYPYDPPATAADPPVAVEIPQAIWGAGRSDPGDAAWTMRHARVLGAPFRARIAVLGAASGGPVNDLRQGTKWRLDGYTDFALPAPVRARRATLSTYETAFANLAKDGADAGLCFFDLHRSADPAMLSLFAGDILKANSPFAVIDFTAATSRARLRSCFRGAWSGSLRSGEDLSSMLEAAGFRVASIDDETRAFLPLVTRGWRQWRAVYNGFLQTDDARRRIDLLSGLGEFAHIWAERLDAMRAGHLQVTRILARRKG